MVQRIQGDNARFRQILRGKIKQELKKYISHGEMIGRAAGKKSGGKETVSIPMPRIDLPHFRYGSKGNGGVGQGDGNIGDPLGPGQGQPGPGAGNEPGGHIKEVSVSLQELAEILGEDLELPNIEPRGKHIIDEKHHKYTGVREKGPESLRIFKRGYRNALKRQISSGTYDPNRPVVVVERKDKRYRDWNVETKPEAAAVIFYMMDVSGSMTDEQKEIVRIEAFWIDT